MNTPKRINKTKKYGFKSNLFASILGTILAALTVVIAILTINVNLMASTLVDTMQKFSDYQQTATFMQSGTSILTETSTSFIQTPVIPGGPEAGKLNDSPLKAYAEELRVNRRAAYLADLFDTYDVSDTTKQYIHNAAKSSDIMLDTQTHALSLIFSVYTFPSDEAYNSIELISLTEAEKAMNDQDRLSKAKQMISQKDYSLLKADVSQNIEACHKAINTQIESAYQVSQKRIDAMRLALWSMIATEAVVMAVTLVLFFTWIVKPLNQYENDIKSDRSLNRKGPVRELYSIVTAYNELLDRRNKLESILRKAAETDVLTGLPNRYSLEHNTLDIDHSERSVAVLLFDVNFLKQTNDSFGHDKGDWLLRTAAFCIKECFAGGDSDNCYRFGGDEFAAILQGHTEKDVAEMVEAFYKKTESENISVSVGYAFESKMEAGSFDKMWKLADEKMYEHKKSVHKKTADENK